MSNGCVTLPYQSDSETKMTPAATGNSPGRSERPRRPLEASNAVDDGLLTTATDQLRRGMEP